VLSLLRATTPAAYPLPLHDALPISKATAASVPAWSGQHFQCYGVGAQAFAGGGFFIGNPAAMFRMQPVTAGRRPDHVKSALRIRSEEHTSELQSRENLVCRLLLEKK